MKNNKLSSRDILLVLLYLPGKSGEINEPIEGRTRLTKMMFIFKKEISKKLNKLDQDSLPEFFAYDYGPFSKDLFDDLRFFESIDFIKENENDDSTVAEAEMGEYMYDINNQRGFEENVDVLNVEPPSAVSFSLTEKGEKYVEDELIALLEEEQKEFLSQFKKKINVLSLDAILEYVYKKYPKFATKSKIKDNYL